MAFWTESGSHKEQGMVADTAALKRLRHEENLEFTVAWGTWQAPV